MLKPTIFREYDIRGIADADLLDPDIRVLGRAIGTYLKRAAGVEVTVGRDCRLSSDRLAEAIIQGLMASGCRVTDIGTVPTPVLYHAAYTRKADGAVMITGSHNPPEYNGFKVVAAGSALYGEQIQQLRRLIENHDLETGDGARRFFDAASAYVDDIAGKFHWDRRVKVVLDAGNGTAGPVMHRLLERLNADAVELFFEMDGHFPNHHPDPTIEKNIEPLRAAVREHGAELGIAFDGDADRIGTVDENGQVIWGDYLLLIYGREVLRRKPGATIIGEVKCSQVLYDELRKLGGNPIMYRTGHSLIKAKMKEEKAALAGEMSGHMFFSDGYYGYDDALYAACRLLQIVADSGQPLSAQLAGLPRMVTTPEIRVDCGDQIKFDVVARVADHFQGRRQVITVDGVRVLFEHGWGLVRASNTQPVLVMRFEAETAEQLAAYRRELEEAVETARRRLGA